ncbi:MAG: hypothetical protein HZA54_01765 [Planctomycetes bacterium]|nr:hypothetical protein [Planctomycetota bacterium]
MLNADLSPLPPDVAQRLRPFVAELERRFPSGLLSITVSGVALTPDYAPGASEVNTLLMFEAVTPEILEQLAALGPVHGRRMVAAPLVLTPEFVTNGRDAFPVELLNLQLCHRTVAGPDPVGALAIDAAHLRLQSEREMRGDVLALRENFIRAGDDPRALAEALAEAFAGDLAAFRAILHLLGRPVPQAARPTLRALAEAFGVDAAVLEEVEEIVRKDLRVDVDRLKRLYLAFYGIVGAVAVRLDALALPAPGAPR